MVAFYRACKLSLSRADARTPMHALCGNGHFCPAAPMRHAPPGNFPLLPNSCGPNIPKTTSKPDRGSLLLGTLAQTLKSPVQPPSLVVYNIFGRQTTTCTYSKALFGTVFLSQQVLVGKIRNDE